jgi:2-polyprenyl-3-methyl-5-hydroxy-6-metoxy-1,4-benzoquinol methylase
VANDTTARAESTALYGEDYFGRRRFTKLLAHLPSDGTIVDFGCNIGVFLNFLRMNGRRGLGIDYDEENIRICRSHGLEAVHANILDFASQTEHHGRYAGIMMADFVEHFDPFVLQRLLRDSIALLCPRGVMVIITPNSRSLSMCTGGFYETTIEHHNPYSLHGLRIFLEKQGLRFVTGGVDPDSRLKVFSTHPLRLLRNVALWVLGRILCGKEAFYEHTYLVMEKP